MNVLLLSKYSSLGASSRIRSYQYIKYLQSRGHTISVSPLFSNDYLLNKYNGKIKIFQIVEQYYRRIKILKSTNQYNLIWIEKEILPWIPAFIDLGILTPNIPWIVDYDDAIFHRYDQSPYMIIRSLFKSKIISIMRRASLVIVGNEYIAQYAKYAGAKNYVFLPSVVDLKRYEVRTKTPKSSITVGWIGTPITTKYLTRLAPALNSISKMHDIQFLAIGADPQKISSLPVDTRPWTISTEVQDIQSFDIGIMPLSDEPFERGKCGYKLIQYMACGKPVIASPVGVNKTIVKHGKNGYLAETIINWRDALNQLCSDPILRENMGVIGRNIVEEKYSLQVTAPKLEKILNEVVLNN
jgi:glycosyltransferase involved in cell wall biosynthesis